ncbi:MAG: hypothetical protein IPH07_22715 [Deltaproteobacteria bacterium]|nr:hypothetical protein [Deltaproteobacteria bacterium]MBK8714208.1 hypothetical protein [Deltaproteobacteria bacterium]MBP7286000.1 hypothetical protein [Nannocystaceae bacterium]
MPMPAAEPATRGLWPLFLATAVGSVAFTICTAHVERSELEALSPADRARVLEQTRHNLEICAHGHASELHEFCAAETARARRAGLPVDHGRATVWRSASR